MSMIETVSTAEDARRRGRDRKRAIRAKGLADGTLVDRTQHLAKWTPEQNARIKDLIANGQTTSMMTEAFPDKALNQICNKYKQITEKRAKGTQTYIGLGLSVGKGIKPSPAAVAERDARIEAELAAQTHLDPNHALLGDPSPARLALARRLQAEREPPPPTLSMSALTPRPIRDEDDGSHSHKKDACLTDCGMSSSPMPKFEWMS